MKEKEKTQIIEIYIFLKSYNADDSLRMCFICIWCCVSMATAAAMLVVVLVVSSGSCSVSVRRQFLFLTRV